uniref:Uncharacterized protein n=1 Tax=Trypanosoma congolense (strain IL3000) TaxID=1068625 RepID=G0UIS5_TRYCI|nr:conserved hypothetical protein [Trypanosoma congolense IL3000]
MVAKLYMVPWLCSLCFLFFVSFFLFTYFVDICLWLCLLLLFFSFAVHAFLRLQVWQVHAGQIAVPGRPTSMQPHDQDALKRAWDAVDAFVGSGNVDAGVFLRDMVRKASYASVIDSDALPLRLLSEACAGFVASTLSTSQLLLIAILNRIFCVQDLPAALARPANSGRPSVACDLPLLYKNYLSVPVALPEAVRAQLHLCVSSLLLLQVGAESVVDVLLGLFGGHVSSSSSCARCFLDLFAAVMSLVSDRRVLLGPVQRSRQRLNLQRHVHLLLTPDPNTAEEVKFLSTVISQAVGLLSECTVQSPQDVAPLFWNQLSSSAFWKAVTHFLRHGEAGEEVVHVVCALLRAIGRVDDFTLPLLMSALLAVSGDEAQPVPVLHKCRVIASALESCVEDVVVNFSPDHALYKQLALAAHVLVDVLQQQAAAPRVSAEVETDVALAVCEGLHVLAQVFTPSTAPLMDSTDDPEDYEAVVGEICRTNQRKEYALGVLREFMEKCYLSLLMWLRQLESSDVVEIACYLLTNECDEFVVQYDDVPVALFMVYERLCKLLWAQPTQRCEPMCVELVTLAARGCVIACAWEAELSRQALVLTGGDDASQLQQSLRYAQLVPVVVRRFEAVWRDDEKALIVASLTKLLRCAVAGNLNIKSVASISESLRVLSAAAEHSLVEALWHGLHLDCGEDKSPRWSLASHLGSLLTPGFFTGSLPFDDCTVALLFSHTLNSMGDVWRVMEALQHMEPDAIHSYSSADRIAVWVRAAFSAGPHTVQGGQRGMEQYSKAVRMWCAANPLHFGVTWRLLRPLCPEMAAEVLCGSLEAFMLRVVEDGNINWSCEGEFLSPYVLETLAYSEYAPRLLRVLRYILQIPATHIDCGSGSMHRLLAVARGGVVLMQCARCAYGPLLELFCEAVQEFLQLGQRLAVEMPPINGDDEGEDALGERLLEELSRFGAVARLVPSLSPGAPSWLHAVRSAVDEYDIKWVLKGG